VLVNKYWGAKGVNLGVKFLDTTNAALKAKILAFANKWNQYANIQFRESATGEIRLTLSGDGYWSYLGPDILQIPAGEPTMSLQGFSLSTPDSEYDRVVPHEFGHSCGFPHEHERQEILSLLDVEKTVALFARLYNWDRQTVMEQVFDPLNPASIRASAPDTRSVMCYDFPASITKNGQAIPGGSGIDLLDGQFVATIYPKPTAPPRLPRRRAAATCRRKTSRCRYRSISRPAAGSGFQSCRSVVGLSNPHLSIERLHNLRSRQ
jgi:hypothetical protein